VLVLLLAGLLATGRDAMAQPAPAPKSESGPATAKVRLSGLVSVDLAPPPFAAFRSARVVKVAASPPRMVLRSERPLHLDDPLPWVRTADLQPVGLWLQDVAQAALVPAALPRRVAGHHLVGVAIQPKRYVLRYGEDFATADLVVVVDAAMQPLHMLDFRQWTDGPDRRGRANPELRQPVRWAQMSDGVLWVTTSHRTYSVRSSGRNGYVSALDPATGELLWQSAPLVSNADTVAAMGPWLFGGYGVAGERSYLKVLDRVSGDTVAEVAVASPPRTLVATGRVLYVRTETHEQVWDVLP
jgi:hypothetical protein